MFVTQPQCIIQYFKYLAQFQRNLNQNTKWNNEKPNSKAIHASFTTVLLNCSIPKHFSSPHILSVCTHTAGDRCGT